MRRLSLLLFFLLIVFCVQAIAADEETESSSWVRYIPYAAAILIYLLSSKLKPKNIEEKKPLTGLLKRRSKEIGPTDTEITYEGYEKNYEPIEPK